MTAGAVEARLTDARAARREREPGRVLAALDEAWGLAEGLPVADPLRVRVAWKRAKANLDAGSTQDALDALVPVLDRDDLFAAYPEGVRGAPRLARAHQEAAGFGHPAVIALWERWSAHHHPTDRYLWGVGRIQLAWDLGCRGLLEEADRRVREVLALEPADLAGGPSRHPEAADAAASAYRLHLDAAHAALRPRTWAGAESGSARDALTAAMEDAGASPLIALEALQEAAFHGHGPAPAAYAEALDRATGFRRAYGDGLLGRADFAEAVHLGAAEGPEWELAGLLAAGASADALEGRASRSGCDAFRRRRGAR